LRKWILSNAGFLKAPRDYSPLQGVRPKKDKGLIEVKRRRDPETRLMMLRSLERPEIYHLQGKDQGIV